MFAIACYESKDYSESLELLDKIGSEV